MSGCNYGRGLNISGFRVCQISAYASVAQYSEYSWIWLNNSLWQGSEYGWPTFHRVLKKPSVLNMPELRIWQRICDGYTGCWISLGKTEYALIMSQNASICLNNTEYDWIYLHIPELTECSICQNSEYVWCSTRDKVTVQVTEQLWRQRCIQNTAKDLRLSVFQKE